MTHFITHHPCPKCGSSDAFAEYSDGSWWCFGCGNWKSPQIKSQVDLENALFNKSQGVSKKINEIPLDISKDFNKQALIWLKSYGITDLEIEKYNYYWSESRKMLISIFNDGLWQGRYFPKRNPKSYLSGNREDSDLTLRNPNCKDRIILVEDMVSAVKVARNYSSAPLLGSSISLSKMIGYGAEFKHVTFWLDSDKLGTAIKYAGKHSHLANKVDVAYSDKDPKDLSDNDIVEILDKGI